MKELLGGYVDDFNILPYNTSDDFICRELDQKMGIEGSVRQFHKNGLCFTPFNRIHVTCEGYLTLCCSDWRNYLVIADLNKMSLTEAWSCEEFQRVRKLHIENKLEKTMCFNCINGEHGEVRPVNESYAKPFKINEDEQLKSFYERLRVLQKGV